MTQASETPREVLGRDDFYLSSTPDPELVDAVDELEGSIDEEWAIENVPQIRAMQELVTDASNISQAASVLVRAMSEFAVDGEDFQPSVNTDLRDWLIDIVRTEVPDIDDRAAEMIVDSVQDYPPIDKARAEELAQQKLAPAELNWA